MEKTEQNNVRHEVLNHHINGVDHMKDNDFIKQEAVKEDHTNLPIYSLDNVKVCVCASMYLCKRVREPVLILYHGSPKM